MASIKFAGLRVPTPAFGLGTAHFQKAGPSLVRAILDALDAGFRHFDLAEMYDFGEALKGADVDRAAVFITHKVSSVDDVRSTVQLQLKNLGTSYIDMLLVHDPPWKAGHTLSTGQIWTQMEAVQREGLVKSFGVSNHNVDDLKTIMVMCTIKPALNQIEALPYKMTANEPIKRYCEEAGIPISVYRQLGSLHSWQGGPLDDVVQRIAARLGISETQVLLQWAARYAGDDGFFITTTSKEERMPGLLAYGQIPISDADYEAIGIASKDWWPIGVPTRLDAASL